MAPVASWPIEWLPGVTIHQADKWLIMEVKIGLENPFLLKLSRYKNWHDQVK